MGFLSWLGRRSAVAGVPGETARVVGEQYLVLKRGNTEASNEEIFRTIVAARNAAQTYTPQQLARLESAVAADDVAEFVTHLVLVESNVSALDVQGAPLQSLVGAINAELRKLGLK